jgi:hypothetical protein
VAPAAPCHRAPGALGGTCGIGADARSVPDHAEAGITPIGVMPRHPELRILLAEARRGAPT